LAAEKSTAVSKIEISLTAPWLITSRSRLQQSRWTSWPMKNKLASLADVIGELSCNIAALRGEPPKSR